MGSHYYAIFSLFAVGAGELARTWRRRQFDAPVWAALAGGAATVLLYLPLIEAGLENYSAGFWSPAGWGDLLGSSRSMSTESWVSTGLTAYMLTGSSLFYVTTVSPASISLLAYPFLIAINWKPSRTSPAQKAVSGFPFEESVAMWALAFSPPLTVLATMWTTGSYVFRYSLPASLGLAWIYAVFVRGCTQNERRWAAWVVTGIVAASFVVQGVRRGSELVAGYKRGFLSESVFASMERLDSLPQLPIVMTSPFEYLNFHHYGPERLRSRLVYLTDAERCLHVTGLNNPEVNLNLVQQVAPLRVEQRSDYLNRSEDFLVLDLKDIAWPPDCRKFEGESLIQLHETDEFVLYRWQGSDEDTAIRLDKEIEEIGDSS